MRKICLLLAIILVAISVNVFAAEMPSIVASSADAAAGDTVDITVSLKDNPGIISLLLNVDYDDTAMTLVEVKDAGVFGSAIHSDMLSLKPYVLFWSNGAAESDYTINGIIATLTFEVSKDAKPGNYPIDISYDKDDDGIFNFNFESVDFKTVNGQIKVKEAEKDGKSGGGKETQSDNAGDNKKSEENGDAIKTDDKEAAENGDAVAPGEVSVKINGNYLVFPDQKPIIRDDRTLVPLRAIFEALGATVDWNDATRTVTSSKGDITISLAIGSDQLYVNGSAVKIDVPAQIVNDRTMVPIRAIAESFNCTVDWEDNTKTVIITY